MDIQGKNLLALASVLLIVLAVAITHSDLSKYQDPLFSGVKVAKPSTCCVWSLCINCDYVATLGYAVWLGSQPAYVTASHGFDDGDAIYQPCYYDCGGERTGYIGRMWDKNDPYVDAAVCKIEARGTQASPHVEVCGFNPAPTSVDGYFADPELKSFEGKIIYSMYRIGHVTGCKGGQAQVYFYDPQYCLLVIYYDPQWQPTEPGDSGSALFQLRSVYTIERTWSIKIAGVLVRIRPVDNLQFLEAMRVGVRQ